MLKRAHWFGVVGLLALPTILALSWSGCQGTCGSSDECGDGEFCSMSNGACLTPHALGFCKPIATSCPGLSDTVCGCDGKTYANPCEASAARQSVASAGACAVSCGGPDKATCSSGTYCKYADGSCGAGAAIGTCTTIPSTCAGATPSPVCGCDGKTYDSACAAQAAGISVSATGACACGGPENIPCEEGKFCQLTVGSCGQASPSGTCVTIPKTCSTFSMPVCDCDHVQYENACTAQKAKKSLSVNGPCPCGGALGDICPVGYFCAYGMTGACLSGTIMGTCTAVPDPSTCSNVGTQVCGCDGNTYDSECLANASGTSAAYQGTCKPIDGGAGGSGG
jgi:hypothetical protein